MQEGVPAPIIMNDLGQKIGKLEVEKAILMRENDSYKKENERLQEENATLNARLARLEQTFEDDALEGEIESAVAGD
jgi:regulator of replication initiation timing